MSFFNRDAEKTLGSDMLCGDMTGPAEAALKDFALSLSLLF